jgi:hypothetical protein
MAGLAWSASVSCVALSMSWSAPRSVRTLTRCGVLTARASERNFFLECYVTQTNTAC